MTYLPENRMEASMIITGYWVQVLQMAIFGIISGQNFDFNRTTLSLMNDKQTVTENHVNAFSLA